MPRGNPSVWKTVGPSYAELSAASGASGGCRLSSTARQPAPSAQELSRTRAMPAAGNPSNLMPKGSGTFVMQNTWRLGCDASTQATTSGRSLPTEAKAQYRPPPEGYTRPVALRTDRCTVPKHSYPNDWKTTKALDFPPDQLQRLDPARPARQRDTSSTQLLPNDAPPQYSTQHRADFPGRNAREAQAIAPCGGTITKPAGYNIITGGTIDSTKHNAFEHWAGGRDYRRTR